MGYYAGGLGSYYAGHMTLHPMHRYRRHGHRRYEAGGLFSFVSHVLSSPVVKQLAHVGLAAAGQALGVPMPVTEMVLGAVDPQAAPSDAVAPPEQNHVGGGVSVSNQQPQAMQQPTLASSMRGAVAEEMDEDEGAEEAEEDETED